MSSASVAALIFLLCGSPVVIHYVKCFHCWSNVGMMLLNSRDALSFRWFSRQTWGWMWCLPFLGHSNTSSTVVGTLCICSWSDTGMVLVTSCNALSRVVLFLVRCWCRAPVVTHFCFHNWRRIIWRSIYVMFSPFLTLQEQCRMCEDKSIMEQTS